MTNVDKIHLSNVIYNLIDNGLKYSSASTPQIVLKIEKQQEQITMQISDNGIGIPKEYRDRIFDKFFRVPTGNLHNTKGYGLGLHYVANIISLHHGSIQLVDQEKGACFLIKLPKK